MNLDRYQIEVDKVEELYRLLEEVIDKFYPKSIKKGKKRKLSFKSLVKVEGTKDYFTVKVQSSFMVIYSMDIDLDPLEILSIHRISWLNNVIKDIFAGTLKVLHDFLIALQKTKLRVEEGE